MSYSTLRLVVFSAIFNVIYENLKAIKPLKTIFFILKTTDFPPLPEATSTRLRRAGRHNWTNISNIFYKVVGVNDNRLVSKLIDKRD